MRDVFIATDSFASPALQRRIAGKAVARTVSSPRLIVPTNLETVMVEPHITGEGRILTSVSLRWMTSLVTVDLKVVMSCQGGGTGGLAGELSPVIGVIGSPSMRST